MESKAGNVYEAFKTYNNCLQGINQTESDIDSINSEINRLQIERSKWDYNDPNVVNGYVDDYIAKETANHESAAYQKANEQANILSRYENNLLLNYKRFSSWYFGKKGPSKADAVLLNAIPRIFNSDDEAKPRKFGFVFNFGKVKILLFIVSLLIIGPAVLVFKLVDVIFDIFLDGSIISKLVAFACGLVGFYYWMVLFDYIFKKAPAVKVIVLIFAFLWVGLVIAQFIVARVALKSEADKILAIKFPDDYVDKCQDAAMYDFKRTLKQWESDRTAVLTGASNPFIDSVRSSLRQEYDNYTASITSAQSDLQSKYNQKENYSQQLVVDDERIKQAIALASESIKDVHYNEAVMTDYVFFKKGDKAVYKHEKDPLVFLYQSESSADIHREIAIFIGDFFSGLVCENHFSIIDYYLVDFETGGSLVSDDKDARQLLDIKMLKVINNKESLDNLYKSLSEQKSRILGPGGTGDISTINPSRIKDGDKPFKYFVVLHYGKEAVNISNNELQLYMGSNKYGFFPVFIMSGAEFTEILNQEGSAINSVIGENKGLMVDYQL